MAKVVNRTIWGMVVEYYKNKHQPYISFQIKAKIVNMFHVLSSLELYKGDK